MQVSPEKHERNLGPNLTQFDVERRIPSSSLGSWENSLGTKSLGFPARAGGDVRITGAGVWKARAAGPRVHTAIQAENRAQRRRQRAGDGITLHRRHTKGS